MGPMQVMDWLVLECLGTVPSPAPPLTQEMGLVLHSLPLSPFMLLSAL